MNRAEIILHLAALQAHKENLEAWRIQERAAFLRASDEVDHAFEWCQHLGTAIDATEVEIEFLREMEKITNGKKNGRAV